MRLRSERIVTPSCVVSGVVSVADGVISGVSSGLAAGEPALDLGDRWLLPGFIDVHVHGGGGAQCNTSSVDELQAVARFHASHGTTALLATTVAAPVDELEAAVRAIASVSGRFCEGAAVVLGAHLEGPFLNRARAGAMDASCFLSPDAALTSRLMPVRMVTLAPELPGAIGVVRRLAGQGVVVSLGHSEATYEQAVAAVAAGARSVTHLFNTMRPLDHREPGLVGAALDLPELGCELICDGVHVDPAVLRLAWRAKGLAGLRLVTDATQAAGMPDGEYRLGGSAVVVRSGVARGGPGGAGALAGSTLTMDAAVRSAVRVLGIGVLEASVLASLNPARLLGIADRKGGIAVGKDADLVVLDDSLCVCAAMVGGRWVSEAPV